MNKRTIKRIYRIGAYTAKKVRSELLSQQTKTPKRAAPKGRKQ